MLVQPFADWSVFKQIFFDPWELFKRAHPRYQTSYNDGLVAKMLGYGNSEKMGFIEYRCLQCGQGKHLVSMSCKSSLRLRTSLFAPGGTLSVLPPAAQDRLKQEASKLAEVFQRSSSNVEGRKGYLSLRNHQLRGLDHPRKRACLTANHNFFLTRADGTTAAERFFGQKPRSMFAAILAAVEIPPAPLSPPRRAVGYAKRVWGGRRGDQYQK
jgi:uncharacterized protein DUF6399